ncbi:MAG: homoserine kinase [Solirubrobacteraceae bacterium]
MRSVRVRVPGSTANLGPGFDVLGAALRLFVDVEVVESGSYRVVTPLRLRRDRGNLVVRGFERLLPAERFEFRINSQIPLSGGIGSSAAGVVAGLVAAAALLGGDGGEAPTLDQLLAIATEIEGHPDNVAASLLGGLVVCDGTDVRRFGMPSGLEAILVVPPKPVRTELARQALPAQVPLEDAVANVAAVAKLVLGLTSGDWDLVADGLRDRLHQPYRANLYPRSARLVASAQKMGALGATISGAGPTVLVWCPVERSGAVLRALQESAGGWAQILRVDFEPRGAYVTDLS